MAQAFTVLFVDDDDQVRSPIAELLARYGLRVLTAGSAREASRGIAREHVDVLFTDIVMPDQDGIELAREVLQFRPGLKIMFTTGYFTRAADAAQLGKVLFKPVRARQIEEAFDDVLGPSHAAHLGRVLFNPTRARQIEDALDDVIGPSA
jgi:DNA-binding NtrC family response regulator